VVKQKNISILPLTAYHKMRSDSFAANFPAGRTFQIGDRGPAGGFVFYDKGYVSYDWRYLEAAPADFLKVEWGLYGVNVIGTATALGTGKLNTQLIVTALNQIEETGKAVQLCRSSIMGGFNDWFLPSSDELDLMYKNLKQRGIGRFSDNWYWSSSQYNNDSAWSQGFSNGVKGSSYFRKKDMALVRAMRAF
jgi:hypothetical protein